MDADGALVLTSPLARFGDDGAYLVVCDADGSAGFARRVQQESNGWVSEDELVASLERNGGRVRLVRLPNDRHSAELRRAGKQAHCGRGLHRRNRGNGRP